MNEENILLDIKNISKIYPGVRAVDDLSLKINKGEIHIIIGENGAGKSTLMKILAGLIQPNSGEMYFKDKEYQPKSVVDSQNLGINMIHQELNLMQDRTVAQNIFINREPMKGKLHIIDSKKMNRDTDRILKDLSLDFSSTVKVKDLSIAQQQMVEVAKAISREHNELLIMDEPTSSLTQNEIDHLFKITRLLKSKGTSIIYISHRMQELMEIGDKITVMRDGKLIATNNVEDVTMDELIHQVVGRKIEEVYPKTKIEIGKEIFRSEKLTGLRFKDVSITVNAGEIVGLAGLIGAGRTEFVRAVYGNDPIEGGNIYFKNKKIKVKNHNTTKSVSKGFSFVPEDRKTEGLFVTMPISTNILEASWRSEFKNKIVNSKKIKEIAESGVKRLNIVTPSIDKRVDELSGGNQQKVILAKWTAHESELFIFDEPTRGIDVGAKTEIYRVMNDLAKQGKAVLMISSDMPELIGMSDRIYVMKDGKITGDIKRDTEDFTQEKILAYAI